LPEPNITYGNLGENGKLNKKNENNLLLC